LALSLVTIFQFSISLSVFSETQKKKRNEIEFNMKIIDLEERSMNKSCVDDESKKRGKEKEGKEQKGIKTMCYT
jgi:hypothetical protein